MSLIQNLRERIALRRQSALSSYAKCVVAPNACKPKDLDALEDVLQTAGKSVDQLEADTAKYQRAGELKPRAGELDERQKAYATAIAELANFDGVSVGEVARRKATMSFHSQAGTLSAGKADEGLNGIDSYQNQRRDERVALMDERQRTGKLLTESKAAATELQIVREQLAVLGIEV